MRLSVIVPSLSGEVPASIPDDPRLEVVVVKGASPVGKARNEGLGRATGDYVAWVDADDEVTEDWLSEILAALESSPDVVTIDAKMVGWKGRRDYVWGLGAKEATVERLRRDVYRDICRPSSLWLYVTRRSLWEGLRFDEDARVAEDYLILPKVLERAASCAYVPRMLYRYVCNPNSLINTQNFELDLEVMKLWARRLEESPRRHRGECLWGMAVSCYWVCDRVALSAEERAKPGAGECARRCRETIRRSMGLLLHEVFVEHDLGLFDRLAWYLRFFCAATNWWWPQKLSRAVRR
jgi:hypothetical protein